MAVANENSRSPAIWPCPTTLIVRDNWERKVIRDETDDTCGNVGRWAVRRHRRWAYARDCEPSRQRARTGWTRQCASHCRPTFTAQTRTQRRLGNRRYERVRTFVLYGC